MTNEHGEKNCLDIFVASSFWERTRGLLGRKPLVGNQGLLIEKCHSVHMLGMKYALDLIYLDDHGKVLKVVNDLKPWRFSICYGASCVVEVLSGISRQMQITEGMKVEWG